MSAEQATTCGHDDGNIPHQQSDGSWLCVECCSEAGCPSDIEPCCGHSIYDHDLADGCMVAECLCIEGTTVPAFGPGGQR